MSEMKRLRESLNRTQEQVVRELSALAARLSAEGRIGKAPTFSVRQYSKWEAENPPSPHPDTRQVLSVYWQRPIEELGFRPRGGGSSLPAVMPMPPITRSAAAVVPFFGARSTAPMSDQPPPWLAETTTGATSSADWRIGASEVELLREAADDMDAIDQQFGGNRLWRPTRAHLHWVHHMIDRGIYDDTLGRQLHAVAGKFTTSLGWFCYDAGLQAKAHQYFSEALNAAMLTGDDMLACRTLSNLARQAVDLNKGREAVRFARLAHAHAGEWQAPNRVIALLAIREAQGYARIGDRFSSEAAIRQAWAEWERGDDVRDPDWTTFLNMAELTCLEGMCRLDLGQTARAQKLLSKSEALQDVAHSRNRGMCLGRLSVAALHNGDIDHSIAATTKALRLIEGGMSSNRAVEQLKIVRDGLAPHHRSSGVADLLEQIRAYGA
ncbi:hypothetical protein [Peterkaempfera bronchialis]|uniref:Transcriptional regulator n=1 Tax=Peterkaempfera bronchialis TaxID=2126346 RepID=A0A345SZ22_9ACTN|nr:hypothetical protein [Peterkaempfera bronchialis]AXI78977.1 hypothetical protein C7M71_017710 [Peterkaempfera bronchialis]